MTKYWDPPFSPIYPNDLERHEIDFKHNFKKCENKTSDPRSLELTQQVSTFQGLVKEELQ